MWAAATRPGVPDSTLESQWQPCHMSLSPLCREWNPEVETTSLVWSAPRPQIPANFVPCCCARVRGRPGLFPLPCSHLEAVSRGAVVREYSETAWALIWMEPTRAGDPVSWSAAAARSLYFCASSDLEATLSRPRLSDCDVGEAALTRVARWALRWNLPSCRCCCDAHGKTSERAFLDAMAQRMFRTEAAYSELQSQLEPVGLFVVCVRTMTSTLHQICAGPLEIVITVLHHEPGQDGWRLLRPQEERILADGT